jgi:hypothetical protein
MPCQALPIDSSGFPIPEYVVVILENITMIEVHMFNIVEVAYILSAFVIVIIIVPYQPFK